MIRFESNVVNDSFRFMIFSNGAILVCMISNMKIVCQSLWSEFNLKHVTFLILYKIFSQMRISVFRIRPSAVWFSPTFFCESDKIMQIWYFQGEWYSVHNDVEQVRRLSLYFIFVIV